MKFATLFLVLLLCHTALAHEVVLCDQDDNPVCSISYPSDWQQALTQRDLTAVSPHKDAWSQIGLMKTATNPQEGLAEFRAVAERLLSDAQFGDIETVESGTLLLTGKGTYKEAPVTFCALAVQASEGRCIGFVFVVDQEVEELYLETIREICATFSLVEQPE